MPPEATNECRICGEQIFTANPKNIFERRNQRILLAIKQVTGLALKFEAQLPMHICTCCLLDLSHAIAFRARCLETDASLHKNRTKKVTNKDSDPLIKTDPDILKQNGTRSSNEIQDDHDSKYNRQSPRVMLKRLHMSSKSEPSSHPDPTRMSAEPEEIPERPKRRRRKVNPNDKRYVCDQCGWSFADLSNMKDHKLRHFDEKYVCDDCGRKFYTQPMLRMHIRVIHKGEKPYVCKYCGEGFGNSPARCRHERIYHAEELMFPCDFCEKKFNSDKGRMKHQIKCNMDANFYCEPCDKVFKNGDCLRRHFFSKYHRKRENPEVTDEVNEFNKDPKQKRYKSSDGGLKEEEEDSEENEQDYEDLEDSQEEYLEGEEPHMEEEMLDEDGAGVFDCDETILEEILTRYLRKMSLLCRICNQKTEKAKNLFDKDTSERETLTSILKITGILLKSCVGVPDRICLSCLLDLDGAIAFRERCLLTNMYWSKKFQDAGDLGTQEMGELNSNKNHQRVKISPNRVDHSGSTDDRLLSITSNANDSDPLDKPIVCKKRGRPSKAKEILENRWKKKPVNRGPERGPYICDQCGKTFSEKGNFNVHLTRHMGVKQFKCQECDHGEFTMHLLKLHVRIKHRGELPYVCKYCGQRFKNCNLRLKHERRHKESPVHRPHLCQICGKDFLDKQSLRVHSVVHTGEQPYHCELCQVKFNRRSSLGTHYRSKTHKKKQEEQNPPSQDQK
nr:zinc finger protein 93 [Drosophila bipectinata]